MEQENAPVTSLILGHSFVRRLRDWDWEQWHWRDSNPKWFGVNYSPVGRGVFDTGACVVLVGEIMPRTSQTQYNYRVTRTNACLAEAVRSNPIIHLAPFRTQFLYTILDTLPCDDGIHVNEERGMIQYYRSIRGAILFAEGVLKQRSW